MAALTNAAAVAVAVTGVLAACRSPRPTVIRGAAPAGGDDITLYRDAAVIRQTVTAKLPATPTTITVDIAAGVAADQLAIVDHGGVTIQSVHAQTDAPEKDSKIRIDVVAPHPGTYSIVVAYTSDALHWDVAYTMTANPARDHVDLRGALAIRNDTGIVLHAAAARVIDAELAAWRGKTAEHLAATLVGGTQSSTLPAAARELGAVELGTGETRVELVHDSGRRMRSLLVYDPIGTKLDNPGPSPLRDYDLGLRPKPSTHVTESFEVARDHKTSSGLPGGPVRLLDQRAGGSLAVLGESRLYDANARVADVDTIAVGTAEDVVGTRERRELTVDEDNKRLVEEFVITLENKRANPVDVLVREHLYRGQNWTLAYQSAPVASKEGPQQISLRTQVAAHSTAKLMYVVVYTWN